MSGAVDFSTAFLKILERLREPISESQKQGLRAEIAMLNPIGISDSEIFTNFAMIYDGFHADIDNYPTLEKKIERVGVVREFYKLLSVKLLRGKPSAYLQIPVMIYRQRKAEAAEKKGKTEEEEKEFAIRQLMTDALIEDVLVKGGRRIAKKKTHRKKRASKKTRGNKRKH